MDPTPKTTNSLRMTRAKLIFNPGSGQPGESPHQLASILSEMQDQGFLPEVHLTRPDDRLEGVVRRAIQAGIKLIVVAGGDGTIDSVIGAMVGREAVLGIIPTGTRNNVAFNLGITGDIPSSVALLRHGRRLKIDVGRVHIGHTRQWFLEGLALGLISDLYPMADGLQHGDLGQIGGLLSTLVSAAPSNLVIKQDGAQRLEMSSHMLLISNMPFIGPHFQISPDVSFKDSFLDLFTFSDMGKLDMLSMAVLPRAKPLEENGIRQTRFRHVRIVSDPQMPVLADGTLLSPGAVSVHVHPRALSVMAGSKLTGQPAEAAPVAQPEAATGE